MKAASAGLVTAAAGATYEALGRRSDRALAQPGKFVDAAGWRVRVYEAGSAAPVVLIVTGAGDCADSWVHVHREIARFSRVVSYDRAGLGRSDNGPPPTLDRYLRELECVMRDTAGRSPVILVGHSLGGLITRTYVARHREQIVGLVLVDATPEEVAGDPGVKAGFVASSISARILKILSPFGVPRLLLALQRMPLYPEQPAFRKIISEAEYRRWTASVCGNVAGAAGAELRSVLPAVDEAAQSRAGVKGAKFGDLPLDVLASRAFGDKWIAWQRAMAQRSTRSSYQVTETKSHNIHLRHPDLVIEAVRKIARQCEAVDSEDGVNAARS